MTSPTPQQLLVGVLATMMAAGGTWLTGQTVASTAAIDRIESTTAVELLHIKERLDRHEQKLDRLLARPV